MYHQIFCGMIWMFWFSEEEGIEKTNKVKHKVLMTFFFRFIEGWLCVLSATSVDKNWVRLPDSANFRTYIQGIRLCARQLKKVKTKEKAIRERELQKIKWKIWCCCAAAAGVTFVQHSTWFRCGPGGGESSCQVLREEFSDIFSSQ